MNINTRINDAVIDACKKDFSDIVIERGENYYNKGNIKRSIKSNNQYIVKVDGNDQEPYTVTITEENGKYTYNCTCPCSYPCKHEYAALLAIEAGEYDELVLKQFIKENKNTIEKTLSMIPADELKQFLLKPEVLFRVGIDDNMINDYFRKYLPNQSYDYYYNNLYNSIVLNDFYEDKLQDYLFIIKQYINSFDYMESFKIIKSIIEAYNDTKILNQETDFIDDLPSIGMYLRVSYRKAGKDLRNNIDNWLKELKKSNYYDNFYLEDIILSVK